MDSPTGAGSSLPQPSLIGLQPSFGFGDRLGLATPGHIEACKKGNLVPFFAQQSVREMTRTERTPGEVMRAAQESIRNEGWEAPWGADADHLKTREDVQNLADAGFTFFTIDPSDYVDNRADALRGEALAEAAQAVADEGVFESLGELESLYLGKTYELPEAEAIAFDDRELLYRAAVKYGKAIAYSQGVAKNISEAETPAGAEIELSVDETEHPTSPLEHLFVGLELQRRNVEIVSLAPRFIGDFEKAIDYKGDLAEFESQLKVHVSIAKLCGPYKISVHSGSDKFAVYPILGRLCGDLLHVKTAGTSYLEALRVLARRDPKLFIEIIEYSMGRFETDKATYHISAEPSRLTSPSELSDSEREKQYLDEDDGRQVMHVTFGSVLTMGQRPGGGSFREALLDSLVTNDNLYREVLALHLGKHVQLLGAG